MFMQYLNIRSVIGPNRSSKSCLQTPLLNIYAIFPLSFSESLKRDKCHHQDCFILMQNEIDICMKRGFVRKMNYIFGKLFRSLDGVRDKSILYNFLRSWNHGQFLALKPNKLTGVQGGLHSPESSDPDQIFTGPSQEDKVYISIIKFKCWGSWDILFNSVSFSRIYQAKS